MATLMISGAYDLAGNQNDGNPRTIAYRDASGDTFQILNSKSEILNKFQISNYQLSINFMTEIFKNSGFDISDKFCIIGCNVGEIGC